MAGARFGQEDCDFEIICNPYSAIRICTSDSCVEKALEYLLQQHPSTPSSSLPFLTLPLHFLPSTSAAPGGVLLQ